jgi:hypothetical protein
LRIPFRDLLRRLRGIYTPFVGVSWEPPIGEIELARKLVTYLEDRRALFYPFHVEVEWQVTDSILQIRHFLTGLVCEVKSNSLLHEAITAMRAACWKYLDEVHAHGVLLSNREGYGRFAMALGELRAHFGLHLARICIAYKIDPEKHLTTIMPPESRDP